MAQLTRKDRRKARTIVESLEARQLFSDVPATTTTLVLNEPVTSSKSTPVLTATVTSDDHPVTQGTVVFFELTNQSRFSESGLETQLLDAQSDHPIDAVLLGTANLSSDGSATFSVSSQFFADDHFTGQFRAAYLGADPTYSLPNIQLIDAQAGDQYGYHAVDKSSSAAQLVISNYNDSQESFSATYLIFPHNNALIVSDARISVEADTPSYYGDAQVITPTEDPVLISVSTYPATYWSYNQRRYYANVKSMPEYRHIRDVNPDLASSFSGIAVIQPVENKLQVIQSFDHTYTNPPSFAVSIMSSDGMQQYGKSGAKFPSRGEIHSADAGLIINTGGSSSSSGGNLTIGGSGTSHYFQPPGPFPTGTVSFYEGDALLATVPLDSDGNATWHPDPRSFTVGDHEVRLVYSGDSIYLPSEDSRKFTITLAQSSTLVLLSSNNIHTGDTLAIDARVFIFDDVIDPTGSVTFSEGDHLLKVVTLGSLEGAKLQFSPGEHTITASYAGNAEVLPSSGEATFTVLPSPNNSGTNQNTDSSAADLIPIHTTLPPDTVFRPQKIVLTGKQIHQQKMLQKQKIHRHFARLHHLFH